MPVYELRLLSNGHMNKTGFYLNLTGSTAGSATVQWSRSNTGPWTQLPNSLTPNYSGTGSGGSPVNGDTLTLSGTFQNGTYDGTCTYNSSGTNGAGYYGPSEVIADPADWAATSS